MDSWNACRFAPGTSKAHVESYFLKLNDPEGRRALWLKATIRQPAGEPASKAVAESWAIVFERGRPCRAAKEVVPYERARFGADGLDIEVAGLRWTHGHVAGAVGAVRFDLRYTDPSPPLVPLPHPRMYTGPFPSSKLVTPAPDARFDGHYEVEGLRTEAGGWRGMQGHNWGRRHAFRYAWGHGNVWDDPELWFEGVTAQIKLGPLTAPPLTLLAVSHRGVRYVFNRTSDLFRARGSFDFRRWTFEAKSDLAHLEGELSADAGDFAGLLYDNPSGLPTHCLNSKIARGRLRLTVKGRAPLEATSNAVALEIATTDTNHGIPLLA